VAAFLEFANLPWAFVYLWVTPSRKARASVPMIPRTLNVTYGERNVPALGSNDISVFPVTLLENAVTHPITFPGEELRFTYLRFTILRMRL
jgi:hypothetical protein